MFLELRFPSPVTYISPEIPEEAFPTQSRQKECLFFPCLSPLLLGKGARAASRGLVAVSKMLLDAGFPLVAAAPTTPSPSSLRTLVAAMGGGVLLPFLWHHGWARGHATCGTELQRHLERQMRHATRASKVIRMEEGVRPRQARARNCVVTIPT